MARVLSRSAANASVRVSNAGMSWPMDEGDRPSSAPFPDVHVERLSRAKVHLRLHLDRLPGGQRQVEPSREGGDMRVHFDQGEMFADTRTRAKPERKIHKTIARRTGLGQEPVRIERFGLYPVCRMALDQV